MPVILSLMSAVTTTSTQTQATAVSDAAPRAISARWIIGARDDLVWFIAPALLGYALFALVATRAVPVGVLIIAWLALVDTPHVFSTLTRTYFDREERRERRRLLLWSLLFFAVGPLMVLAGTGAVFFYAVALWAHFHQVKQHYGFMVLYKKKNRDLARADNLLDRALLLAGFAYPVVAFLAREPSVLKRLPASVAGRAGRLTDVLLAATIFVALAWALRQFQRAASGLPLNLPKYLLLAAALPLHWVVLLSPRLPFSLNLVVAILSPLHALQYHRLMWFHNRKYAGAQECRERYGAAAVVSGRLLYYAAFILLIGLGYHGLRYAAVAAGGRAATATQVALAFLLGCFLIHFHLDAKIWRVRRDPSVGAALGMD